MPRTVNEILLRIAIARAVDLQKYGNAVVRRIVGVLNESDPDLLFQIRSAVSRLPRSAFTVQRLDQLLESARRVTAHAMQRMGQELTSELRKFIEVEAAYQEQAVAKSLPRSVASIGLNTINIEQVYTAVTSNPLQGRLLSEWSQDMSQRRNLLVRDALRMGYVQQQTTEQMVQRIRGTREKKYQDGILDISRREAATLARTATAHSASVTREQLYKDNKDLVQKVRWVATLDNRTSHICRIRDGKEYNATTYKPIGHSLPWLGGPGNAHWNALVAGTLVQTKRGLVPIESVVIGDAVLAHSGHFARVTQTKMKSVKRGKPVRVVHLQSGRVLRATDDHPVAVWLESGLTWRFVGTLNIGDQLLQDAQQPVDRCGVGAGLPNAEAEDGPTISDKTQVSLQRTAQLCAAAIGFNSDLDVGPSEIDDCATSYVLWNPSRALVGQSEVHHFLALGHALKQLGCHHLSDLLSLLQRDRRASSLFGQAGVMPVRCVGGGDAFDHAGQGSGVVLPHHVGVAGVLGTGFLGQAKGPVMLSLGGDSGASSEVQSNLFSSSADFNAMSPGMSRERPIGQALGSLDVSQGSAASQMFSQQAGEKLGTFGVWHGDCVVALEVQHYTGTLHDLTVAGEASYTANGVVVSNCRSVSVPVLKSWRELGFDADELEPAERASMDGMVPGNLTYGQWLMEQSVERQNEILGVTRATLLRKGGMEYEQFANRKGEWLTLEQLRRRHADAFRKAGVE